MKRALVVGATGYAGREVCQLLAGHPEVELAGAMRSRPGVSSRAEPVLPTGVSNILPLDPERFGDVDAVLLCTPHGAAAELARHALDAGTAVVDLSADFRLRDPDRYAATYGAPHPAPELLDKAVYGLTEHARADLHGARLVANPGCYPTSILLPLLPLIAAGQLAAGAPIIADAKSGVSGAGAAPSDTTHFGNVHENFRAYGVGTHRHAPEIWQAAGTDRIVFVPHLLPCFRGILTTLYLTPTADLDAAALRATLAAAYEGERFVRVLESGTPELAHVQHTNRCHMGLADAGSTVVLVSVIDNLRKGAASQAVQNLNLVLGLEEGLGLS